MRYFNTRMATFPVPRPGNAVKHCGPHEIGDTPSLAEMIPDNAVRIVFRVLGA